MEPDQLVTIDTEVEYPGLAFQPKGRSDFMLDAGVNNAFPLRWEGRNVAGKALFHVRNYFLSLATPFRDSFTIQWYHVVTPTQYGNCNGTTR